MVFDNLLVWGTILLQRTKGLNTCRRKFLRGKKKNQLFLQPPLCPGRMCLRVTQSKKKHNSCIVQIYTILLTGGVLLFYFISGVFFLTSGSHRRIVGFHLLVSGGRMGNPHRNTKTRCHFISSRFLAHSQFLWPRRNDIGLVTPIIMLQTSSTGWTLVVPWSSTFHYNGVPRATTEWSQ